MQGAARVGSATTDVAIGQHHLQGMPRQQQEALLGSIVQCCGFAVLLQLMCTGLAVQASSYILSLMLPAIALVQLPLDVGRDQRTVNTLLSGSALWAVFNTVAAAVQVPAPTWEDSPA